MEIMAELSLTVAIAIAIKFTCWFVTELKRACLSWILLEIKEKLHEVG